MGGITDSNTTDDNDNTVTVIEDGNNAGHRANVIQVLGVNRLATDSNISSVNVPLGKDPLPDCYFTVTAAGAIGDTVRIQIAATNIDPTPPDGDLPAVDLTYTLIAADAGDEKQLAANLAEALENDTDFIDAKLEADSITGDLRPIVHISSTEFSLNGENYERPNAGDVSVTTTGTTTVQIDTANQVLVSRPKEVSLGRDPDNPHRLGVQAISGSVRVRAENVEDLFEEFALDGADKDLTVNGTPGSPAVYTISANPAGGLVKIVEVLKLYGTDTNIKVGEGHFMGANSPLTNGILIEITKGGMTDTFRLLKTTNDVLARMASSPEKAEIINQSGGDYIVAAFDLVSRNTQLSLDPGTTDKIEVKIQDNLNGIDNLFFVAEGFLEED